MDVPETYENHYETVVRPFLSGLIKADELPPGDEYVLVEKAHSNAGATVDPVSPSLPTSKMPGYKEDEGKNRLSLIFNGFASALEAVGRVGTFGAAKYTDNGWSAVPDGFARYTDAMYRHLLAEAQQEQYDPETHLLHSAHAAWNALARLELQLRQIKEKHNVSK